MGAGKGLGVIGFREVPPLMLTSLAPLVEVSCLEGFLIFFFIFYFFFTWLGSGEQKYSGK